MRRLLTALFAVLFLVGAACATEETVDTATPEPTPVETPDPSEEGPDPVGDPSTEAVESDGFPSGGGEIAYLIDVRVAAHPDFDRIVLEFDGDDVPAHRIMYIDPPIREDGSGNEVEVAGEFFLELRMTPATGVDLSGEEFELTYEGPSEFRPGDTEALQELVRTGDFEANLAWVAGVDREARFGVTWLQDPLRLVVDILHD